ncbi:hypothetical protein P879_02179 [Paragonimus westermani]|uniref:ABC transporter domain-containing protein n=1 Tax=Paragonimus westermani TaxID=34504 RepID=A0A8T0DT53_9TREM|nr:hypothetical protein P879_02179 [Paragonimus westermani]
MEVRFNKTAPDSLKTIITPEVEQSSSHNVRLFTAQKRRLRRCFRQFRTLLWKNWLLRRRSPFLLCAELTFPLLFVLILVGFRSKASIYHHPACHVHHQSMPSMGLLLYIQSIMCNFNYTCYPSDPDNWQQQTETPVHRFVRSVITLVSDKTFGQFLISLNDSSSFSELLTLLEVQSRLATVYSAFQALPPVFIQRNLTSDYPSSLLSRLNPVLLRQISQLFCGTDQNDLSRLVDRMEETFSQDATFNVTAVLSEVTESMAEDTQPSPEAEDNLARLQVRELKLCRTMKLVLTWKPILRIAGRLRHFLFGRIAYFPNTSFTNQVVFRANRIHRLLAQSREAIKRYFVHGRPWLEWVMREGTRGFRGKLSTCMELSPFLPSRLADLCTLLWSWSAPSVPAPLDPVTDITSSHWTRTLNSLDYVISVVESILDCMELENRFIPFSDQTAFDRFLVNSVQQDDVGHTPIGVLFEQVPISRLSTNSSSSTPLYSMVLRVNPFLIDTTFRYKVLDRHWIPSPRRNPDSDMKYFTSGFLDVQETISEGILITTGQTVDVGTEFKLFPTAPYSEDIFLLFFGPHLPQLMILAWSLTVVAAVKYLVDEREHGLLEMLHILKVPCGLSHLSWFALSLGLMMATCLPMIFLLKLSGILANADPVLLVCFLLIYGLAILSYSLVCSLFFHRANLAAVVAGGVYFLFYLPAPVLLRYESFLSSTFLITASLLPQVSYTFGWAYLLRLELQGSGARWSDLWSTDESGAGPYSLGLVFLLLGLAIFIQMITALFVFPWIQSRLPIILAWIKHELRRERRNSSVSSRGRRVSQQKHQFALIPNLRNGDVTQNGSSESPSSAAYPSVVIRRLHKVYRYSSRPHALCNVNLEFYPNEVDVLLGNNGAGKTTLLSILAGTVQPTSGIAQISNRVMDDGCDQTTGYCSQRDILYPNLTVTEHIFFYSSLRGVQNSRTKRDLDRCLTEFGFSDKRDCLTATLSGGQQRKLSVCLAFLGSPSSVILLDEPTAGVDPLSKRIIWDSIRSMRTGRSIVLTSHHMREAEYLSDRIAFMADGKVCSTGSSVSLRAKYGSGYLLTLESKHSIGTVLTPLDLLNAVRTFLPEAVLVHPSMTGVVIRLPLSGILDGRCVKLLEALESSADCTDDVLPSSPAFPFPISQFSITDTSLDDVFLTVIGSSCGSVYENNDATDEVDDSSYLRIPYEPSSSDTIQTPHPDNREFKMNNNSVTKLSVVGSDRVSSLHLPSSSVATRLNSHKPCLSTLRSLYNQAGVILYTRFYYIRRNKRVWFFEFFLPCALLLFALILFSFYRPQIEQPLMDLHPWLMTARRGRDQVTFVSTDVHCMTMPDNRTRDRPFMSEPSPILASVFNRMEMAWIRTGCLHHYLHNSRSAPLPDCSPERMTRQQPIKSLKNMTDSRNCSGDVFDVSVHPPERLLFTHDRLLNLTLFNISEYLLQGHTLGELYGGISVLPPSDIDSQYSLVVSLLGAIAEWTQLLTPNSSTSVPKPQEEILLDTSLRTVSDIILPPSNQVRLWYNNKGYASSPAYLNMLYNLLFELPTFDNQTDNRAPSFGLNVANHPLPFPEDSWFITFQEALKIEAAFALFFVVALTVIPANFAFLLVSERQSGLKHLQQISGLQPYIYWLTSFIWDFLIHAALVFICLLLLCVFRKTAYVDPIVVAPFVFILLLYGLAMIPLVYLATFLFTHPSTAYVLIGAVNMLIASVTLSISVFLKVMLYQDRRPATKWAANHVQRALIYIFPHHCLSSTVFDLTVIGFFRKHGLPSGSLPGGDGIGLFSSVAGSTSAAMAAAWELLYPRMICLLVQTSAYLTVLLFVEYRFCGWRLLDTVRLRWFDWEQPSSEPTTPEANPLNVTGDRDICAVDIRHLSKRYRGQSRAALDDLNLSVHGGECFGLLGTNGAGKSTTFALLTGQYPVPRNVILLNGKDLSQQLTDTQSISARIGYCPQRNALHEFLTARETLYIYGRLRGLSGTQLTCTVNYFINSTGLSAHADYQVRTYSGGTKRKLSTALAFIGDPEVILLDEPSSGMDPSARRLLWTHIRGALKRKRAIILSSHCMDECETLCSRVGLLVDGRLQCEGSPRELRQRFNVGFSVDFELTPYAMQLDLQSLKVRLHNFLPDHLDLCQPLSVRQVYRHNQTDHVAQLFHGLQAAFTEGLIRHYSVKRSTLEDVFVKCIASCPPAIIPPTDIRSHFDQHSVP